MSNQKKIFRSPFLILIMALVLPFMVKAQNAGVLPLDPSVRTGKLANGFTYFIRRNTEPQKRVIFYLVNKVGSVLENENQRGLAHFLEHMNFNGTTHYPKNELINYLEKSGVRFGADLNAYTNFDETVYQLPIASDDPELLKNGLQIMRDWAHGASLNTKDIDDERGVILEEKRSRSGAAERIMDKTTPIILNNSIYADREPIGTQEVLTTFKPAAIRSFYDQWYRPNLQALIVVGDIDPVAMEISIKALFSDLKNPEHELIRKHYSIPLTGKSHFIAITDKEVQQLQIQVIKKFRATQLKTVADYRDEITHSLFNNMISVRLNELSQKPDLPYLQAGSGIGNYLADLNVFSTSITLKPDHIEAGFKMVYAEIERIKRYGFTQRELERAKSAYLSGIESLLKEKDKTNSVNYVNEYVAYFLKDDASPGIETEYRLTKEDLRLIKPEDINALAVKYVTLPDQDIIITAPDTEKDLLPSADTVNKWIAEFGMQKLTAYQDQQMTDVLLPVKPTPGKVTAVHNNKTIGFTEYTLSNGVRVILKPTKFKNDEIIFNAFKAGGSSLSTDSNYHSASNAVSVIAGGGIGQFNADELQKLLTDKQVSVGPFINELFEGVQGGMSPKDKETAFQLIYLFFTQPRKDEATFKNLMSRVTEAMKTRGNNPDAVFADTINAVLSNYNFRRVTPGAREISKINLDSAYNFYRDRFKNASDFTFVFTGSFDENEMLPLCEQYLGGLPATNKDDGHFRDLQIHTPQGDITRLIYKGSSTKATVQMIYHGNYIYNQDNNIKLNALSEIIELRLLERLREAEGQVYTPQVHANYNKLPENQYELLINFNCAPQNAEGLIKATIEEIDKLKNAGIAADDLDKFKAESLKSYEVQKQTNSFWLANIAAALRKGDDMNEILTYPEAISKLDAATLKQAANDYLSGKDLVKFILKPQN